jgi:long-subunit fatty acid transport protein
LLLAGFAYFSTPVSHTHPNAFWPFDRQLRYAAGVQYQWNERINIGGAFEYGDMGDAKIDSNLLKGDYQDNQIFFIGVNMSYKFGGVSAGKGADGDG